MTSEGAQNSRKGGKKPTPPSPTPINASPHGNVLGDFELGRVIGRGGMGTVYEAWQRSLERTVAVKVLADHIAASPKSVQRFEREAQAAAKLHHTHIIPIYARGEHNGKYYYAMELIEGPSLYDIITEGRERQDAETATIDLAATIPLPRATPPDRQATAESSGTGSAARTSEGMPASWEVAGDPVSLASQFNVIATHIASIADALGYAHAQGVVHRDVKPQNLILGEDGRLRIADFGLARIAHQPGVTVTGEVLGSPLYMSPEQISGEPGKVDHRTDIYSLGATMYEWLTLEPPHPGDTRETVIAKILTEDVASLRSRNPSVPVDLETLCLKALQHDPSRRFASAGEFRDDLKRFVENRPIKARRAGVMERVRKFIGRHQVATLGTLAAIVALGLGWALLDTRHEVTEQTAAAVRSQEDTDRLLDLLEYIPVPAAGMMLEGIAGQAWSLADESAGTEDATAPATSTPEGIAQRATRDLYDMLVPENPTGSDSEVDASDGCTAALGSAWANRSTNPNQALGLINLCLAQHPTHVRALHLRTALLGGLGEFGKMEGDADHLVRLQVDRPIGYLWRGLARLLLGQPERCLEDLDLAAQRGARPAWVHSLRGLAMMRLNRPADALASLDEALADASTLIVALLGRATACRALGKLSLAATALTQVLDLEPKNTDALIARGDNLAAIGNFDGAIRDFDAAIDIGGRTPALALRVFTAMLQQRRAEHPETAPDASGSESDRAAEPTETIQQGNFDWFSTFVPQDGQESSLPGSARPGHRPRGSVDR